MGRKAKYDMIARYLAGNCTKQERTLIESAFLTYLKESGKSPAAKNVTRVSFEMQEEIKAFLAGKSMGIGQQLTPKPTRLYRWIAAAASILLCLSVGYHLFQQHQGPEKSMQGLIVADILPGTNRASLTLADGRTIDLSSEHEGVVVDDKAVSYLDGSPLVSSDQKLVGWNTISTPRGGQYKLVLPDGTIVTLNAASALRYPAVFNGSRRTVELLEGEGYFEVTRDETKPFRVLSKGQVIEVLGTTFNVNAYEEETYVRTTLVDGKITVGATATENADPLKALLSPGEETLLSDGRLIKQKADISAVIGWKEGFFVFNNADMATIIRQLSRWYDFEVDHQPIPDKTFSAEVPRTARLSTILEVMESNSDFKFQIKRAAGAAERRLIINE